MGIIDALIGPRTADQIRVLTNKYGLIRLYIAGVPDEPPCWWFEYPNCNKPYSTYQGFWAETLREAVSVEYQCFVVERRNDGKNED
jgi:hypothetical protein